MQNKSTTIIILLLLIIAAVVLFIAFKKPEVVPVPASSQDTSLNQQPQKPQDIPQNSGQVKTYTGQGFSFKYDSALTTTVSQGSSVNLVTKDDSGEATTVMLVNGLLPDSYNCPINIAQTTTINGKLFRYCDSQGEPVRLYYYSKNGKTLIAIVPLSNMQIGYLDVGSLEIN